MSFAAVGGGGVGTAHPNFVAATRTATPTTNTPTSGNLATKLRELRAKELTERIRLAKFGTHNRRNYEHTTLQRFHKECAGLLYQGDQLRLNGDGSFTPYGPKREAIRKALNLNP